MLEVSVLEISVLEVCVSEVSVLEVSALEEEGGRRRRKEIGGYSAKIKNPTRQCGEQNFYIMFCLISMSEAAEGGT